MYEDIAWFLGFQDELKKVAFSPAVANRLDGAGSIAGIGAGIGGLIGGARGAYKAYQASKDEHGKGSILQGALGGLGGAFSGVATGAVAGGALGALAPGVGKALGDVGRLKSFTDFGKRQVHGLTGWVPEDGLHSIGGGAFDAKRRHAAAVANIGTTALKNPEKLEAARTAANKALAVSESAQKAEQMGLTNIPGYLKSMTGNGVVQTLAAGARPSWRAMNLPSKALMVGAPVAGLAINALKEDDGHKGEAVGTSAGQVAALGLAGLPALPLSLAAGASVGGARLMGKTIDRIRHKTPDNQDFTQTIGQMTPHEVMMSPAASGQVPEGW